MKPRINNILFYLKVGLCGLGEPALLERQGEYRMGLPPNIPGAVATVPEAKWLHCESCGEDVLSVELEEAIRKQCRESQASPIG